MSNSAKGPSEHKDRPAVALASKKGAYLSCDRPNPLGKPKCGKWEEFKIIPQGKAVGGRFPIALMACHTGLFLKADPTGTMGFATRCSTWETFSAEVHDDDTVSLRTHHGTYVNVNSPTGFIFNHKRDNSDSETRFVLASPGEAKKVPLPLNGSKMVAKLVFLPVLLTASILTGGYMNEGLELFGIGGTQEPEVLFDPAHAAVAGVKGAAGAAAMFASEQPQDVRKRMWYLTGDELRAALQ